MSKRIPTKILAIDPGTRAMGVAFLDHGQLLYHEVKTFSRQGTPNERLQRIRQVVIRLISDLQPEMLVVEKTHFANNRNAALLNILGDEIWLIGKRRGVKVIAVAPSTVKKAICGHGRAGKQEIAAVVVSKFPKLKVYLSQDRKWKTAHHANMFDAVALGLACMPPENSVNYR